MPTATPDVVVQGFGAAAAAYFDRTQGRIDDLVVLVYLVAALLVVFIAAGVVRDLARPRR